MPKPDAVLLDTHALLWWQADSDRLSTRARAAIDNADAVLVSPITFWEVAMLVAKGRVDLDRPVEAWTADVVARGGPASAAELTPMIAASAGSLTELHGDPADRLIYATAQHDGVPLVTKDSRLTEAAASDGLVTVIW